MAALAFSDKSSARAWLAEQPQADPLRLLDAVLSQIEAIDAAELPPAQAFSLLSVMRVNVVPVLLAVEPRFFRKALPIPDADQQLFEMAWRVWQALALADLNLAPKAEGQSSGALLRAAMALRHAVFAHYQASQAVPASLDDLFVRTLQAASESGVLELSLPDPDFADLGEGTIAGELIWTVLLRQLDPYHWSGVRLTVANRVIRRWRNLAGFMALPAEDPRAPQLSLARLFPGMMRDGMPGWVDVRQFARKIRKRCESLAAGETPESLKLGTELSPAACGRLLEDMAAGLRQTAPPPVATPGSVRLCFGGEDAYLLFVGRPLNVSRADMHRQAVAHQRMEIFGFDRFSMLPGQKPAVEIPAEIWVSVGHAVARPLSGGARRLSPCLVATVEDDGRQRRLGVLNALQVDADQLKGQVSWYAGEAAAGHVEGVVKHGMPIPKYPVFRLLVGDRAELIAPPNAGIVIGSKVKFASGDFSPLQPTEVLERGADFVRFACQPA